MVDTADPLRARARRRERDAKTGGRLRITARSLMVLRKRY
jgi:glycogen operon protein